MSPSDKVLESFSLKGAPVALDGGQGTSFRVENFVLKKGEDTREVEWIAEVMSRIGEDGFRVARPKRTKYDQWSYDNWFAYAWVEGQETKSRWAEKIRVSRKFHQALSDIPKPDFLAKRTHPWSIADQMIWGELPLEYGKESEAVMRRLEALSVPISPEKQLIHGDMNGNILFHETLPPAIIDFSPYWQPAEYANAIIVVDAIVWENAPGKLLAELPNTHLMNQLLVRTAMWRLKTSEEFARQYGRGSPEEIDSYMHLIKLLEQRIKQERDR